MNKSYAIPARQAIWFCLTFATLVATVAGNALGQYVLPIPTGPNLIYLYHVQ